MYKAIMFGISFMVLLSLWYEVTESVIMTFAITLTVCVVPFWAGFFGAMFRDLTDEKEGE